MIALLLALACKPPSADTADSPGWASFHGQAWRLRPYRPAPPWPEACTRPRLDTAEARDPIPASECWLCVELAQDGAAAVWWGDALGLVGELGLGAWAQTPEGYDVDGTAWAVRDRSTADPWTQTASLWVGGAGPVVAYQPSESYPELICSE